MERDNKLLEQYKICIELFKHYLDLAIKFNLFYYAITGGILSFYFANRSSSYIQYILCFPILVSIIFSGFFLYGAKLVRNLQEEIKNIAIELKFNVYPEAKVLYYLLNIFAILFLFVSCVLISLLIFQKYLFNISPLTC
jgi:hypothetical protein